MGSNRKTAALLCLLLVFFQQGAIKGEELNADIPKKDKERFWAASATGDRPFLRGEDENEIIGYSGRLSLFYGWIKPTYVVLYGLDLSLGPYSMKRKGLLVDYQGIGLTTMIGSPLQGDLLRNPEGNYGFMMGVNYLETVGRSIGYGDLNKKTPNPPYQIPSFYQTNITELSLLVGTFYSFLKVARPDLKIPESLITRMEGSFVTMMISLPLRRTRYASKSQFVNEKGEVKEEHTSGSMQGFRLLIGWHGIIGL